MTGTTPGIGGTLPGTTTGIERSDGTPMLAYVDPPFDDLLRRAKTGDEVALGRLLESYNAYLKLVAGSLLRAAPRSAVDISDVVQETKLKAWQGFFKFEGSDEPQLVCWLRRILENHVFNHLKKQGPPGRRPESLEALLERSGTQAHRALAVAGSTPSNKASGREQAILTARALESLEPRYREVLVLHHLEGVPHGEIGRRLGCSEGASRMLLMRAARAFEQKLNELL